MTLDVESVREQFPALSRIHAGKPVAYFDGPAGSQIPQDVIDAVADYLAHHNANTHGRFETSRETDELLSRARDVASDFLHAPNSDSVVFGANMTSLTFALSRSLARTWSPGDEVIVTRLDHDANITPWVLAARDLGAVVRKIDFDPADTTLEMQQLLSAINDRTRLVAVGAASNATGTKNPIVDIGAACRRHGAELFVDAVHLAPHEPIDVAGWGCDFVVCSAYKFFGPHVGMLWGRPDIMASLPAYQVRPAGDGLPDRWMTGTPNFEGIAGTVAAIEYIASLGAGGDFRKRLIGGYEAIMEHEQRLLRQLLLGLRELPEIRVWGITDPGRFDSRVPTVSITHRALTAQNIAEKLGDAGVFVWDGNYYAVEVTEALGLEPHGMIRIGILHYNTATEVSRLLDELRAL